MFGLTAAGVCAAEDGVERIKVIAFSRFFQREKVPEGRMRELFFVLSATELLSVSV